MKATTVRHCTSNGDHAIRVRGARVHNLRGVDVDVPRGALVAFTGVSGSGKSSLAFDTLFAEGQRRYLECLSAQVRSFVDQLERPDADAIEGLPPTVSVAPRAGTAQRRSTLATVTEIHDFLRLLYARAGAAHCTGCGRPVSRQTSRQIVDRILELEDRRRVMILAPLVRGKRGAQRGALEQIVKAGFVRARVDGQVVDAADPPPLASGRRHDVEAVVDRIVVKEGIRPRLQESVELALKHGEGACLIAHEDAGAWHDRLYSEKFACPQCGLSFSELEPRTFSFNSPYGACPECQGLGATPDGEEGAPDVPCPACGGARLNPFARGVTFAGQPLHELSALTVAEAAEWVERLPAQCHGEAARVAGRVLPEISGRLRYLLQVGLDYLTLDRPARSLSGGEFQRARLAGCLGSGLIGVCYVLDEPTVGLHPRDTGRLADTLEALRDQGNTVIVVEHDADTIRRADWVIDLGPGAGTEGGRVVAAGTPPEIARQPASLTGRYLSGAGSLGGAGRRRPLDGAEVLTLTGARRHNLQEVTLRVPLGRLVCVSGVSGSGKSSLVTQTLVPAVRAALGLAERSQPPRGACDQLIGGEHLERVVEIDQSPIGRTARSNPATFSGLWDEVRRVLAGTREARLRGYTARRFSFNSSQGRCAECQGHGVRRIEMHVLPDVHVPCAACRGARFNRSTLAVRFAGKHAADVLALRIDEAAAFFANFPRLKRMLATFAEVGLGYLTLGQSSLTLSGGEAQRVRLATELCTPASGRTLFVLDEPTTGLHPADVEKLLGLLQRLVHDGNSVLVIEHHLDVLAAADWLIDLGPEGGAAGGQIVAEGPPADVARTGIGHTAQALADRR